MIISNQSAIPKLLLPTLSFLDCGVQRLLLVLQRLGKDKDTTVQMQDLRALTFFSTRSKQEKIVLLFSWTSSEQQASIVAILVHETTQLRLTSMAKTATQQSISSGAFSLFTKLMTLASFFDRVAEDIIPVRGCLSGARLRVNPAELTVCAKEEGREDDDDHVATN